ncbi:MAG TPA: cytochrome c3 family protein [Gemmatimonadota bacterium]|nr:cytochrome c3 family protein [Gemmatimonadota bacterium]
MRSLTRSLSLAAALALAGLLSAGAAAAQAPGSGAGVVQCAKCHADRDFLAANTTRPGQDTALFVPPDALHGSAHDTLACTDCHRGFEAGFPHRASRMVVPCETCHEQEGKDYDASIHARNAAREGDAPTCVGCHGSHAVLGPDDPDSPTYPLNVAGLCGRCHGDPAIIGRYFNGPGAEQARIAARAFPKSVHGIALTRDGLVVSATCSDCHRAHLVLPADSPRSSVNRANIPETCGSCHAGVERVFEASAHGRDYPEQPGVAEGHDKPVCVDCHTSHQIVRADQPAWQVSTVARCGSCHEKLYETYFDTYHGQVTRLGFDLTAKCSDCHTAHDMRPATDPKSSVFAANLVSTCGQCHERANANFVKYYAHGDPTERTQYPRLYWPWLFMTFLLAAVMTFFVIHSVLWMVRVAINRGRRVGGDHETGSRGPEDREGGR